MLQEFLDNFKHNLFKPLLLFFYAGFLIPVLGVKFEFPKVLYQGLTIFLLLAIGWHGGEELAKLDPSEYAQAAGFMVLGFVCNCIIGVTAYGVLRMCTNLRNVDAATVAGYYGSDSAGTFVTCQGVLIASSIAFAAYMPVMLAIMEIPGCFVALLLIAHLRRKGMDANGNMPGEIGYGANAQRMVAKSGLHGEQDADQEQREEALASQDELSLQKVDKGDLHKGRTIAGLSPELLHEVFLNPGIFLLFAGIAIGFISSLQGASVIEKEDRLFTGLFNGILCLFLLEMGITASKKLKDLRLGGWRFILFALLAPNVFAIFGMLSAHAYSLATGHPLELGTYAMFAVLCGAASYIAMPAVQRMAIPEASPTLPLAASLGLTFSYNVTIGIPVYLLFAKEVLGAH